MYSRSMRIPQHADVFAAQFMAHAIWYMDIRCAQAQQVSAAVVLDTVYGLLTIYTYQTVLDKRSGGTAVFAYLLGGL